ncbi:MAG: DUF3365 domain-containing protein [Verrucomicrobiae bacterium]|nr:DUF3365 domain-containing protein [Verrucomicrobiae bacterium]
MILRRWFILLLVPGLFGCSGGNDGSGSSQSGVVAEAKLDESERFQEVKRRGREAANALKGNLFNAQMKSSIESGGAASALQICQTAAMPITDGTAQQFDGVTLHRTSLKVRNPANKPDPSDLEVLTAFQVRHEAGMEAPQEIIKETETEIRYYEPLFVKKICLNCHGSHDSMAPEVVDKLRLLYPDDQAYGYEEGDFRGVIRVDFADSKAATPARKMQEGDLTL